MSIGDLASWLVAESERRPPLHELFDGFCLRLAGEGISLWRVILGLETLHPEVSGTMLRWDEGAITKIVTDRAGILTSESYLRSPTRIVDETGRPFRWRAGQDTMGMPRLEEFAEEHGLHYRETRTVTGAFLDHLRWLKVLGNTDGDLTSPAGLGRAAASGHGATL